MFVDEADIKVTGGHGGAGLVSFGKKMHSGPNGGNGGKGGVVYLIADDDLTLLEQFVTKETFEAEDGHPGGKNRKTGGDGEDLEIKLPIGTSVIDRKSGETLFELKEKGQKELICRGGKGGRGNFEFRSSRMTTPKISQPGLRGDRKKIKLVLQACFFLILFYSLHTKQQILLQL